MKRFYFITIGLVAIGTIAAMLYLIIFKTKY